MAFHRPYHFEDGSRAARPRRMLPNAMSNSLTDWTHRVCGMVALVVLAAIWLSLASWSQSDPSFSHATQSPALNWLGRPGSYIADALIQPFGLLCIAVLIAPTLWAFALATGARRSSVKSRVFGWALGTLSLTAIASALPTLASWPLRYGYGGFAGDTLIRALEPLASNAQPEYGVPIMVAMFAILGSALMALALGIKPKFTFERTRAATQARQQRTERAHTLYVPPQDQAPTMQPAPAPRQAPKRSTQPASEMPLDQPAPSRGRFELTEIPVNEDDGYNEVYGYDAPPIDPEFEAFTEAASSNIAARFAPTIVDPVNVPRSYRDALTATFTAPPTAHAAPAVWPVHHHAEPQSHFEQAQLEQAWPTHNALVPMGHFQSNELTTTSAYKRPSLNLLERPITTKHATSYAASMMRGNARLLEDVLADFGITGTVRDIKPGPVVTLYEVEPARGTKAARIISLASDIARAMGVVSARIAIIPGRSVIGVELPNQLRETVYLRDIFDGEAWRATMDILPIALGKTITGEPVVADLARMPHLLVAGTTGSGKSVGINAMILSLIYKHGPEDCRLLMIDPKMLELSVYNGIPHLLTPVVTDPHKAITALSWCVTEMEERYKRMASLGVRNIDVFNNRVRNAKKRGEMLARTVQTGFDAKTGEAMYVKEEMTLEPMPYIVIVVDEFADLMAVAGKEIEASVARLAQMARAAGIHLIMTTQRPTVDIITGAIKANMPARVSYKVASKIDSRTILNGEGAETLLGNGDLLFTPGSGDPVRVHGPFVSDEEVEAVADSLRQQGVPRYVPGLTDEPRLTAGPKPTKARRSTAKSKTSAASEDALYDRAVAIVVRDRRASVSHLQKRLDISQAWATSIMARLEADGVITDANASGHHAILVGIPGGKTDAA
jgi:DNA segregation ATPase FtsK/SpoIIIE, S-DNA-T family